jgi:DNA-directed RNA polymerase subunit M/transcription elongation factor TFIIS
MTDQLRLVSTIRSECLANLVAISPSHTNYFQQVEQHMYQLCDSPTTLPEIHAYRRKFTQLWYNLKLFPDYLIAGFSPLQLVCAESAQLNPKVKQEIEENKKRQEEYQRIQTADVESDKEQEANETTLCRYCRKPKQIGVLLLQIRRADEGMTAFYTCYKCNGKWREN